MLIPKTHAYEIPTNATPHGEFSPRILYPSPTILTRLFIPYIFSTYSDSPHLDFLFLLLCHVPKEWVCNFFLHLLPTLN